jgi:hypothetical protein
MFAPCFSVVESFSAGRLGMVRLLRAHATFFLILICVMSQAAELSAADYDYAGEVACITPFDSRYLRIQEYLESHGASPTGAGQRALDPSQRISLLKRYLRIASRFSYLPDQECRDETSYDERSNSAKEANSSNDSWQLPNETEYRGAGDCEDKAIWLYVRLIETGVQNVRLVVGKYRTDQPAYHAWVVCHGTNRTYILDPTMNAGLWQARHYPRGFYRPLYSYSKGSRWRHLEPSR